MRVLSLVVLIHLQLITIIRNSRQQLFCIMNFDCDSLSICPLRQRACLLLSKIDRSLNIGSAQSMYQLLMTNERASRLLCGSILLNRTPSVIFKIVCRARVDSTRSDILSPRHFCKIQGNTTSTDQNIILVSMLLKRSAACRRSAFYTSKMQQGQPLRLFKLNVSIDHLLMTLALF